jgi:hypothetical protein
MKLQSLTVGCVLFCLGFIGLTGAGCTATASGSATTSSSGGDGIPNQKPTGAPTGCADDTSLTCSSDALGISCPAGTSPDSSTLICSDPTANSDGTDGYCCVEWNGGSCTVDTTLTCPDPTSYGFTCPGGSASPDSGDAALICSTPVTDASGNDTYCCTDTGGTSSGGSSSGGTTAGCSADGTLACDTSKGEVGVDCTGGATPAADANFGGYICSDPATQSDGSDGYCCATGFTGSTCVQDPSVDSCAYPSVGFSCTGSDTPDMADGSLSCSTGVQDPTTGDMLFCCQ